MDGHGQRSGKGMVRRLAVLLGSAALVLPMAEPVGQPSGTVARYLLAMAATAMATPVQAQTVTTLVSNTGQTRTGIGSFLTFDAAQSFTAGNNDNGYKLTAVDISLNIVLSGNCSSVLAEYSDYSVAIWGSTSDGLPDSSNILGTLTNPTLSGGDNVFTFNAPGNGLDLDASTTYFVVIDVNTVLPACTINVTNASSNSEDPGNASGWSIGDNGHYRSRASTGGWTSFDQSRRIAIKGYANSGGTTTTPNAAPTVANQIADQTATVGTAFSFPFPATTFNDADGDTLTYTVKQVLNGDETDLSGWLSFDDTSRTFSGTPQASDIGTITVKVTASDGTASISDEFDIVVSAAPDTEAPTVVSIMRSSPTTSPTNENELEWLVQFSEVVENVNAADFTVSGTSALVSGVTNSTPEPGVLYLVTVSGGDLDDYDGPVTLGFASGQNIQDEAGNTLTATTPGTNENSYEMDNTAPTVSITAPETTATAEFTITISFSEEVNGFAENDIMVSTTSGDYGTSFTAITPGQEWRFGVTLAVDNEVATISIPAGVAQDDAGNDNSAAQQVTTTYTIPNTPPTSQNSTVTVTEDTRYTFSSSEFSFTDDDNDSFSRVIITSLPAAGKGNLNALESGNVVAASDLPYSFTPADIDDDSFGYTPPANANGDNFATFKFKVNDGEDDSTAEYTMTINITAVNDAPTVASGIADQTVAVGGTLSLTIPDDAFEDVEDDDSLTYEALLWQGGDTGSLPNWISFTTATGAFEITPGAGNTGTTMVQVTATDSDSASVSTRFEIEVVAAADPRVIVTPPASTSLDESAMASYTLVLNSQPSGPVTVAPASSDSGALAASPASLTFTTSNWDTAQTVSVTAIEDDDAVGETVTVSHGVSGYGSVTVAPAVTVTVTDNDTAGVSVSTASVSLNEGEASTYTVTLDSQPGGNVTISASSSDSGALAVSPASLTFTTSNWDTAQPVTVTSVDDADTDNETVTVSHGVSGYGSVTADSVTVTVTDNDTAGVSVTPTNLTPDEGETTTYTVTLDTQPSGPVTISTSVSGDSGAVSLSTTSLTFTTTNWETAQMVTVTAVEDEVDNEDQTVTISHGVSGYGTVSVAAAVTVTVTDDDTAGVSVQPTSLTPNEGETTTYTVTLATQPPGNVTISPSNSDSGAVSVSPTSLTFTTTNWDTAQPVSVTAVEDENTDDETVSISHSVSGYGSVTADSVTVMVTDAGDTTAPQVSSISLQTPTAPGYAFVTNADSLIWRVTFSEDVRNVDGTDFTVTANGGSGITVTVEPVSGQSRAYDVTASGGNLATLNGVSVKLVFVSGQNIEDLAGNALANTTPTGVNEFYLLDNDAPTVNFIRRDDPSNPRTNANTLSWHVQLFDSRGVKTNSVDKDDFMVTGGSTATVTSFRSSGAGNFTVVISGGDLEDYNGEVGLGFASGQDIEDVIGNPLTATTPTGDNEAYELDNTVTVGYTVPETLFLSVGTAIPPIMPTTADTDIESYSATTLPAGLTIDASNGEISGTPTTASAASSEATVTVTDDLGNNVVVTLTFPAVVEPGVRVDPASLPPVEGQTLSYSVVLDTPPSGPVTITTSNGDSGAVSLSPTSVTFTTANWDTPQTVSVTAVDDSDTNSETVTVSHSVSGYGSVTAADAVTISVTDDDTPGVNVQPTNEDLNEGETLTYTVRLITQPSGPVTITSSLSGDSSAVSISPASLTFTPSDWSARMVTVTAVEDDVDTGDQSVTISHSVSGYGTITVADPVTVTVTDNDTAGVSVIPPANDDLNEGGTSTYTLVLTSEPTGNVTITPTTSGDSSAVSVEPPSLTFTTANWDTARTVTVTAVDDDIATGNQSVTISHSVSGYDATITTADDVMVTVTDDDTAGVSVTPPANDNLNEGGTLTYTVTLNTQPGGPVTITPTTSGDSEAVSVEPASLTFTTANWDTARTVTVTAVDDDVNTGNQSVTISHSVSGYDATITTADDVMVTVTDDDTAGVSVTPPANDNLNEGGTLTYTVTLNTQPGSSPVTITPTTSGDSSAVSVEPASLTFTTTNWDTARTVTVTAVDDDVNTGDQSVTISHGVSGYGAITVADDVTVTVTDDDTAGVSVTPPANDDLNEGGTLTYTVTLNTQPGGPVTITPATSGDSEAVSVEPASLTITPSDWNTPRTVTVTAVDDEVVTGNQSVTISHGVSGYGAITVADDVTVTVTEDDTTDENVTPEVDDTAAVIVPTVNIAGPSSATVSEGDALAFTLTLDQTVATELTVDLTITETGEMVSEAGGGSRQVTVSQGQTQTVFTVATDDDDVDETDSTVTVTVVGDSATPATYQVGTAPEAVVTVADNDDAAAPETDDTGTVVDEEVPLADTTAPTVSYTAPQLLTVGTAITITPTTVDGDIASYDATGLPAGLTIDSGTGVISGTPTTASESPAIVTVTVTDTTGNQTEVRLTFPVVVPEDVRQEQVAREEAQEEAQVVLDEVVVPNVVQQLTAETTEVITSRLTTITAGPLPIAPPPVVPSPVIPTPVTPTPVTPTPVTPTPVTPTPVTPTPATPSSPSATTPTTSLADLLADTLVALYGQRERLKDGSLQWQQAFAGRDFVLPLSSFNLAQGETIGAQDNNPFSTLAIWGGGDYSSYNNLIEDTDVDGDGFSATIGMDLQPIPQLVTGLALTTSRWGLDYATDDATATGTYDVGITVLNPYLSWSATNQLSLWATIGYGRGEVEHNPEGDTTTTRTDALTSWAGGVRLQVVPGGNPHTGEGSPFALAIKGDGAASSFLDTSVQLARLAAEVSRSFTLENGLLSAAVELGWSIRTISGDATLDAQQEAIAEQNHSGGGAELAGNLNWRNADGSVSATLDTRVLLGGGHHREWGIGGYLRLTPSRRNGEGLSLTLHPSFGVTGTKLDELWSLSGNSNLAISNDQPGVRLDAQLAYGFPLGTATLTPYTEWTWAETANVYGAGLRYGLNPFLELDLKGARHNNTDGNTEHRFSLDVYSHL